MQYPVPPAIEHPELLMYRAEFPLLQRKTYLNSCSLGALSMRSMQNVERFLESWNEWGASAWDELWMQEIAQAWQKFANLIGAQIKAQEFTFRADAARIEMGTPAMAAIYAANGGLDIVQEVSVESICERSCFLTNDLIAQAREHGWKVRAPLEPELRSSIVMLELEQPQEIVKELTARDIIVDARPDLLRVSPYFYNTLEENKIVIEAIAEILENRTKK